MKATLGIALLLAMIPVRDLRAASFTNVFQPGYTTFSNPFDITNSAYNYIYQVMAGGGQTDFDVEEWYGTFFGFNSNPYPDSWDSDIGWIVGDFELNPGEGVVIYVYGSTPYTNVFRGNPHTPILPINLVPGQFYFLSDQTLEVGSYESIVGSSPVEGSTVYLYTNQVAITNFAAWDVHTFSGGTWHPSAPVIPAGGAAMFQISTNTTQSQPRAPTVSQWKVRGGQIQFSFNAESNRTYAVEFRALTNGATWGVLTNIPVQGASQQIQISDAITTDGSIYRIRTP
jgi:hypothetical protein